MIIINMNSIKKKEIYRPAVQRKTNLEITGEEKPKTRLRRRKPNKRPFREKKQVCAFLDEKSQFLNIQKLY